MFSFWQSVVVVTVLVIANFLWISKSTTAATSTNAESNVWFKRENSSQGSVIWQGPPTTPWPTLSARKLQNQPVTFTGSRLGQNQFGNTQNFDNTRNKNSYVSNTRNVGVDLSYGLNPVGPNKQHINRSGSGNVGVDLSYGLNSNQNNRDANRTTIQNFNYAKVAQNNPVQQNNQNVGKTAQNLPGVKATMQSPGSQTTTTGKVGSIPIPNAMTGSKLQTGNTTTTPLNEDDELREFSETLLKKDVNNAAKYVTINYQAKTTSRSSNDEAPEPLLTIQKEAFDIPSIANLLLLHNNYILETNVNEHVSPQEKIEENNLLDTLLTTSVMQHTRNFLIQKGAIGKDPKVFRDKLKEIWFNMYSRGQGRIGSSGFEHVFLAELKNNDVSGLHNWLYFHDAEAKKSANYLGYLKKIELENNNGAILKYHFTLEGKDKPVGSMFIGTSPELEIALYSTCFLLRANKICPLRFGGKNFIIRTYTYRYRGKDLIGSAFPEI